MISPSPTAKIDPTIARGTLGAIVPESAGKPAHLVFMVPNTNYQLHLIPRGAITAQPGKRLLGTIRVQAKRIDIVTTGGQYVEPVYGRPRRVQGTILTITSDAVVVDAGVPIHCTPTDPRQSPGQFQPGQFVSFDVMDGASFTQA